MQTINCCNSTLLLFNGLIKSIQTWPIYMKFRSSISHHGAGRFWWAFGVNKALTNETIQSEHPSQLRKTIKQISTRNIPKNEYNGWMEILHPPYFSLRIISRKLGRLEAKTCAKTPCKIFKFSVDLWLVSWTSRKDSGRLKTVAVGCAFLLW